MCLSFNEDHSCLQFLYVNMSNIKWHHKLQRRALIQQLLCLRCDLLNDNRHSRINEFAACWISAPVKALVSVRRQVLLQLVVGLLDFPTEVFQLAVQRVLQAGGVVRVHRHTEPLLAPENGDGATTAQGRVPIVPSPNRKCRRGCFVCVRSKKEKGLLKTHAHSPRTGGSRDHGLAPRTETDRQTRGS